MTGSGKRAICLALLLSIGAGIYSENTGAASLAQNGVITGTYQFTSTKDANRQIEDHFVFREDCFLRSSFDGCSHLEELSAQTALASASWYGPQIDPYEKDYRENAHNLVGMLEAMGFEDIETNAWYSLEKKENTIGAGIGRKTITGPEGSYTLLAVIPRSCGYKQEWAGDFTIGAGNIHEGFLAARDEVLRFTKHYMEEFQIQGPLKVWTVGHSRGAAVANLTAAFFAEGGISYFGDNVSITPEDIYCYGFATPGMVKESLSGNDGLFVSSARGGEYAADTPGEDFYCGSTDISDPHDSVFGGIHNYPASYDLITYLPPKAWGYTCFNTVSSPDENGLIGTEDMLEELQTISPAKYESMQSGGDPRSFEWMSYDVKNLEAVPDETQGRGGVEEFLAGRVAGLIADMPEDETYVSMGYQDSMKAVAGLYGLLANSLDGGLGDSAAYLIKGVALSYFSYAAERLCAEGRARNEAEGVSVAIEDLLEFITGTKPDHEKFTVDDFVDITSKYLADHADAPITAKLTSSIEASMSAGPAGFLLRMRLTPYYKKKDEQDNPSDGELFMAFLKACAYGPESGTAAAETYKDVSGVRRDLYGLLTLAISFAAPDFKELLDQDGAWILDGSADLSELIEIVHGYLLLERTEEGERIRKYATIGEAADEQLVQGIDIVFGQAAEHAGETYGTAYRDEVLSYVEELKTHITQVRKLLSYMMFYTEGEPFSTKSNVVNVYTFLQNKGIFAQAHAGEIYLAWARAANKKGTNSH